MVDLVKIRKKSKDAKPSEQTGTTNEALPAEASAETVVAPQETVAPKERPPAVISVPEAAPPVAIHKEPETGPEPAKKVAATAVSAAEAQPPASSKKSAKEPANDSSPEQPARTAKPAAEASVAEPVAIAEIAAEPAEDFLDEDRLSRFKRLAGKRRRWSAAATTAESSESEVAVTSELELLRFRVAGEDYAVDIDKIVEIVPPRSTTRVPNADESIVGIISLRGTIVTVIDLRRKLGHPGIDFGTLKDARMIVVERAGETAGFLVDRVSRVVKLDRAQLENHPIVSSAEQSEFVSGVFQSQDGLVILLDIERILAG